MNLIRSIFLEMLFNINLTKKTLGRNLGSNVRWDGGGWQQGSSVGQLWIPAGGRSVGRHLMSSVIVIKLVTFIVPPKFHLPTQPAGCYEGLPGLETWQLKQKIRGVVIVFNTLMTS